MSPVKTLERAVVERLTGGRPSPVRAAVGAAVAGGAVAAGVYRGLRRK
jgi:hypothetical protein